MNQDLIVNYMSSCSLCPRNCKIDRIKGETGFCGMTADVCISRADLHFWEEPCISGQKGSGAVFFTGCNLSCIYCQNAEISGLERDFKKHGRIVSVEELSEIFLALQDERKANNINLVTGVHFVPQIAYAIERAKNLGLKIPIIYNTSSYEKVSSLRLLDGLVDVYLPDLKYLSKDLSNEYSHAKDYPEVATAAIEEMHRQVGKNVFEAEENQTLIKRGVIVRHLLLPGHVNESKRVLKYLHDTYGDDIYISIMSQYTPMPRMAEHPLLKRRVTKMEYERLTDYAVEIGIVNGFIQDRKVAKESFIPDWL